MRRDLPSVGTAAHLELLSEYVPDDFINELMPRRRGVGRRCCFSASQTNGGNTIFLRPFAVFGSNSIYPLPGMKPVLAYMSVT